MWLFKDEALEVGILIVAIHEDIATIAFITIRDAITIISKLIVYAYLIKRVEIADRYLGLVGTRLRGKEEEVGAYENWMKLDLTRLVQLEWPIRINILYWFFLSQIRSLDFA